MMRKVFDRVSQKKSDGKGNKMEKVYYLVASELDSRKGRKSSTNTF